MSVYVVLHAETDHWDDGHVDHGISVHPSRVAARGFIASEAMEEGCSALKDVHTDDGDRLFAAGEDCTMTLMRADMHDVTGREWLERLESGVEFQRDVIEEERSA